MCHAKELFMKKRCFMGKPLTWNLNSVMSPGIIFKNYCIKGVFVDFAKSLRATFNTCEWLLLHVFIKNCAARSLVSFKLINTEYTQKGFLRFSEFWIV